MDPKGRVVWITGASSGIGEALALAMARAGAKLILSARNEERLNAVCAECKELGAEAQVLPLDLAGHESLPARAKDAEKIFGTVEILINNGGVGQRATALATAPAVEKRIWDVNFFGAVVLTKAVLPSMVERRSGQIVVISSTLGKFGAKTRSSYSATKHALHGYFDSLRAELHEQGIVVTLICPGYVRTNISLTALEADGSAHGELDPGQATGLSAEACAEKILKAVKKNRSEVMIGGWLEVSAVFLKRFLPSIFERLIRGVDPN